MTVTANAGQTKVYGTSDPALTYTVGGVAGNADSGLLSGDSLSGSLERASGENAGLYSINQGTLDNGNYDIHYSGADFTITKRPVAVTIGTGQGKVYGDPDPITFAYTTGGITGNPASGMLEGDMLEGNLSRVQGEDAGEYRMNLGSLYNANYELIQNGEASFIIEKARLSVSAVSIQREYGDENPELTVLYDGFKRGDSYDTITSITVGTPADKGSHVGIYPIRVSGGISKNYIIDTHDGTLTILPATLTYIADNAVKYYGQSMAGLTGTITGFKNRDTLDNATIGSMAFTTEANEISPVGLYPIKGGGLSAKYGDYVFAQSDKNSTALTIIAPPIDGAALISNTSSGNRPNIAEITHEDNNSVTVLGKDNTETKFSLTTGASGAVGAYGSRDSLSSLTINTPVRLYKAQSDSYMPDGSYSLTAANGRLELKVNVGEVPPIILNEQEAEGSAQFNLKFSNGNSGTYGVKIIADGQSTDSVIVITPTDDGSRTEMENGDQEITQRIVFSAILTAIYELGLNPDRTIIAVFK